MIPRGALRRQTTITAEQMPGRTNSVRFSPEGLQFEQPAGLVMNYRNCLVVLLKKKIVYTDEKLKILEVLRSLDLFGPGPSLPRSITSRGTRSRTSREPDQQLTSTGAVDPGDRVSPRRGIFA